MKIPFLNSPVIFPALTQVHPSGIVASGGDLTIDTLLQAYSKGIFPWFSEQDPCILWWCPPERMVLSPGTHKVQKSMRTYLNGNRFELRIDTAFVAVILACARQARAGQNGTWITPEMQEAYVTLHEAGYAHSFETWHKGQLVGALYGVSVGKVFCGESMFSSQNNASKFAFIKMSEMLQQKQFQIIDCQNYTEHLASLGAGLIDRASFLAQLSAASNAPSHIGSWSNWI